MPKVTEVEVSGGAVDVGDIQLWLYGDLNNDGKVNAKDVTQISKRAAGNITLSADAEEAADVTRDNKVNAKDVTALSRYSVGNPSAMDDIP